MAGRKLPSIFKAFAHLSSGSSTHSKSQSANKSELHYAPTSKSPYNEVLDGTRFRLLRLSSKSSGSKLKCTIEVYSLSSSLPAYEAISYVCGVSPSNVEIECNGVAFLIRPSLYTALERFRLDDEDRLLWADQICINQVSNQERSAQVKIMKHIFRGAKCVLMWLGPCDERHPGLMKKLLASLDGAYWSCVEVKSAEFPSDEELEAIGLPPQDSDQWQALDRFATLSYFMRIWIVQEVCFARQATVSWGTLDFDWDEMRTLLIWSLHNLGAIPGKASSLHGITHFFFGPVSYSFPELLYIAQNLEASDERDKFFVPLGMLDRSEDGIISPEIDYAKSLTQVRCEATRYVLEEEKHLRGFSYVQHTRPEDLLPSSWALKSTSGSTITADNGSNLCPSAIPLLRHAGFNASKEYKISSRSTSNVLQISLQGLRVDHVKKRSVIFEEVNTPLSICRAWQTLKASLTATDLRLVFRDFVWTLAGGRVMREDTGYPSFCTADNELMVDFAEWLIVPFWHKTPDKACPATDLTCFELLELAMDSYQQTEPDMRFSSLNITGETQFWLETKLELFIKKSHSSYEKTLQSWLSWASILKTKSKSGYCRFNMCLATAGYLRSFVTLGSGKFGLAPEIAKENDIIVILFGGSTPYMLRPDRLSGEYSYIGECYIQDYMNGQAIDMLERGKVSAEWFLMR